MNLQIRKKFYIELAITFSNSTQMYASISVNCAWSDWNIGDCSVSCGLGTRSETRKKKIIEQNGGECIGESNLTTECHDQNCPGKKQIFCNYRNHYCKKCRKHLMNN